MAADTSDPLDLAILQELSSDARLANNALAARIGVANSTALARVRNLVDRGVIRRFTIELDYAKLGRGVQALVGVQLRSHQNEEVSEFRKKLVHLPEVVQVFHTGGEADFLVHVAVGSSEELRNFLMRSITSESVVRQVETHIIFGHDRGLHPC